MSAGAIVFGGMFSLVIGILGIAMYLDWKAGAVQSYIREDGTIHEWDRFGNQNYLRPDGHYEKIRPTPGKGLGLYD